MDDQRLQLAVRLADAAVAVKDAEVACAVAGFTRESWFKDRQQRTKLQAIAALSGELAEAQVEFEKALDAYAYDVRRDEKQP